MDPDGLIPPWLVGFTVSANEPPCRLPPCLPLRLGQPGLLKILASSGQLATTARYADTSLLDAVLYPSQPGCQDLTAALLPPALSTAGIAPHPPLPATDRHRQAPINDADRPL